MEFGRSDARGPLALRTRATRAFPLVLFPTPSFLLDTLCCPVLFDLVLTTCPDKWHRYIKQIYAEGSFLVGGELEVLDRITWGDGLDEFRKTPNELRAIFKEMGADAV